MRPSPCWLIDFVVFLQPQVLQDGQDLPLCSYENGEASLVLVSESVQTINLAKNIVAFSLRAYVGYVEQHSGDRMYGSPLD